MRELLFTILLLLNFIGASAQVNLVKNPSMEEWEVKNHFIFPVYWSRPSWGMSGLFTMDTISYTGSVPVNDFGFRYPFDGRAYCGIYLRYDTVGRITLNYREYLEAELTESLTPNKKYCVSFYVSLDDSATIAVYNIGAYFSSGYIYEDGNTDTLTNLYSQINNSEGNYLTDKGWAKIAGHFSSPIGAERYFIIGNFKSNKNTPFIRVRTNYDYERIQGAGYYVDMATVIECDDPVKPTNAGNDKIVCTGDSTALGSFNSEYYDFEWQPTIGLSNPKSGTPNASPAVTTTYTLTQKYFDFPISTDEVTVTVKDCKEPEGLIVYPNPIIDNITFKLLHGIFTNGKIEIFDVIGRKILTLLPNNINIISAEMSIYAKGTYLYRAYSEDKMLDTGKFVIQ
jgi:hypothetical protein